MNSALGDIVVLVGVVLVPLHVVPVDERLDPLLQVRGLDGKLELREEFVEQEGVAERLSHLHDADDGGVDLVLPVLEDALLRRLLLLGRLLHLDLIDLDEDELVSELSIVLESIAFVDVLSFGRFQEHSEMEYQT